MTTFFTSDTHFFHRNIIKFCNRPFGDVNAMNEAIIQNWNKKVKPGDVTYHLGDFGFTTDGKGVLQARRRLNGNIILILGNHDEAAIECQRHNPNTFQEICHYKEFLYGKKGEIVLFHYGLRTWHHDLRGSMHLYGHSHSSLAPFGKSFDVGVDCWNFEPLSLEEVEKQMSRMPIGPHPRFENFPVEV